MFSDYHVDDRIIIKSVSDISKMSAAFRLIGTGLNAKDLGVASRGASMISSESFWRTHSYS
jgi:hypothetical protein